MPEKKTHRFTCQAPGCGQEFTRPPNQVWSGRPPRYCSNRCRTAWGQWSYPATHASLKRVYGVVKS